MNEEKWLSTLLKNTFMDFGDYVVDNHLDVNCVLSPKTNEFSWSRLPKDLAVACCLPLLIMGGVFGVAGIYCVMGVELIWLNMQRAYCLIKGHDVCLTSFPAVWGYRRQVMGYCSRCDKVLSHDGEDKGGLHCSECNDILWDFQPLDGTPYVCKGCSQHQGK